MCFVDKRFWGKNPKYMSGNVKAKLRLIKVS
jgi:hypothetical protein